MKLSSEKIVINRSKCSKNFILMHKDIPLLNINEENGTIFVYKNNEELLPYALRKKDIVFRDFERWASRRSLLLERKNSKLLLNICDIPQDDKYEISKRCKMLSIDDCFWIKETDGECWNDVDLRKQTLSNSISKIALEGESVTISGEIETPEFTVAGFSPKAWKRENTGLYLYKKSTDRYESEREVLVSDMLDVLEIEHVHYEMVSDGICKCKCMTNDEVSRLTYGEYRIYCENNGIDSLEIFDSDYNEYFMKMAVVDYIIGNLDRHADNWGFYIDNSDGQILKPHPLFDHNLAFAEKANDSVMYSPANKFKMLDLAENGMKEYKIDIEKINDFSIERFYDVGSSYDIIKRRINNIIPPVITKVR